MTPLDTIRQRASWVGESATSMLENLLLRYPQFEYWSGSHMPTMHHYGKGGLVQHTSEVIQLCFQCRETLHLEPVIDSGTLFFAALFHDTGKIYDYIPKNVGNDVDLSSWSSAPHKRIVHHISRSALIWNDILRDFRPDLYGYYHENVLHAILSHHGQREWGSPVAPKSHVAWMLHLCDGISARMNDCNKMDQLDYEKTLTKK